MLHFFTESTEGATQERQQNRFEWANWMNSIDSLHFVERLFDQLPDVGFFAKDAEGRFTMGDRTFLRIMKCKEIEDLVGKNDFDFFPDHVARKYVKDDRKVIETGEPLLHVIEMVPKSDSTLDWHEAHKIPILTKNGKVIGITGITAKLSPAHLPLDYPPNLGSILEFIGKNYGKKMSVQQLADIANMSERSLERHFKKTFETTPLRYLKSVRINAACHALSHSGKSISDITLECGFCDQSHMTSEFRRVLGVTPREYRMQNGRNL
ncbi:MAG: AraC family transcriptional regulator [Opitutales bacterium]|nr:AraC family transcriptional regulator [Opitutales bacterium]